jgi:hypothetical protein
MVLQDCVVSTSNLTRHPYDRQRQALRERTRIKLVANGVNLFSEAAAAAAAGEFV